MSVVSDNDSTYTVTTVESVNEDHIFAEPINSEDIQTLKTAQFTQQNIDRYIDKALEKSVHAIQRGKKPNLDRITHIAPAIGKYGVKSSHIDILLDLIFSQQLTATRSMSLVKLLLPRSTVSQKQILRIYGNLSCRDYSSMLMDKLLEWVICIYDYIDGKEHISNLYAVLFHYLTIERLRPRLCHILFRMTKKVHVKAYRVRFLSNLAKNIIPEPQLIALIKLYHNLRPELKNSEKLTSTYGKNVDTNPDPKLKRQLEEIRKLWSNETTPVAFHSVTPLSDVDERQQITDIAVSTKKRKGRTSSDRKESPSYIGTKFLRNRLQDEFDPHELVKYLDRQSIPEQILSVLDNRMIQHIIVCNPNDVVIPRICNVLAQQLMDLLYWNHQTAESKEMLEELLNKILKLARFAKAHIPVMEIFLARFLRSWNGLYMTYEIFELLTFIKPRGFEDIFESYLKPLYRLFSVSDVQWKAKLILCYKNWLTNWALLDWRRHSERRQTTSNEDNKDEMDNIAWLFQGLSFNIDYFGVMQQMIYHVDRLCVQGLVLEQDHPILQHASLSFFEFISTISLHHDIPTIILPAASLVYRSFFSSNAMAISRICGILHNYKLSFEDNDRKGGDWMDKHSEEYLDHFNTYVLDICNCLWRNLAFSVQSTNSTAFSVSSDIVDMFREKCEERDDPLNLMFSLTHSSAFAGLSKHFMKMKENELNIMNPNEDPVTVESVKRMAETSGVTMTYSDYRVEYLSHLDILGFHGIHDLLYSCMSSLINRQTNG
ncbi:Mis6-domain-containing protein [Halteromyces radiatus]|uniref:Mis6-domain-containing protein n=1 Tax=Halteromyces radiatus TaxID=101107 RepID=UPI00221ED37D|nr:Mis6-domain-containing protein [Halteromyces radiatus]KAI8097038.1 Mis6-domain-containing protein [Halteromyces radiatus]